MSKLAKFVLMNGSAYFYLANEYWLIDISTVYIRVVVGELPKRSNNTRMTILITPKLNQN